MSERIQRWCGICFAWREQREGRCVECGNAHMTGEALPLPDALPSQRASSKPDPNSSKELEQDG